MSAQFTQKNLISLFELSNKLFMHETIPSKSSACLMMPICFKLALKFKMKDENILGFLSEVLHDDTAFNKKNVADNIRSICEFLHESGLSDADRKAKAEPYFKILSGLFSSDSDTVRNTCYESFLRACELKMVSSTEIKDKASKGLKDLSWRIRY